MDGGLRQLFKKHLPEFHWQAIETFITGSGVPDINGCFNGIEVWIENKFAKGKKRARVTFSPEQVGWIEQRLRHGGRVFIAVRHTTAQSDTLYLLRGAAARELIIGEVLGALAIGSWDGGPACWDWDKVKDLLLFQPK
jgi:hypothetical protein